MLPVARSDASMMADSRDEPEAGATSSDATSAPAVAAWELQDARRTLREWTLSRYLAARPTGAPIVFSADTTIGAALTVRLYQQMRMLSRGDATCIALFGTLLTRASAQRMAEAGILSAPVLDALDGHPASNWLGFLDVSDIVTALLKGTSAAQGGAASRLLGVSWKLC
jgi:hypothetical protein